MRRAALALLVALGGAACHAERGAATGAPAPILTVSERLDVTSALPARPGVEWDAVAERRGADADGAHVVTLGLAADGTLVTAASRPAAAGEGGAVAIAPTTVRLESAGQKRSLEGAPAAPLPHEAVYAAADARTVAWIESSSTELDFFEWRVLAHDRASGATRLLADSAPFAAGGRLPVAPGESVPTLAGGSVVWATSFRRAGSDEVTTRLVARDAAARTPLVTLADGAKLPAGLGDEVYFVRSHDVAPALPADRFEVRAVAADGTGRERLVRAVPLAPGAQVTAFVAEPGYLAWVVGAPGEDARVQVLERASGRVVELGLEAAAGTVLLAGTAEHLVVASGSGGGDGAQLLLDVRSRRLWKLGEAPGYSLAYAAGDFVAWSQLGEHPEDPAANRFVVARWR